MNIVLSLTRDGHLKKIFPIFIFSALLLTTVGFFLGRDNEIAYAREPIFKNENPSTKQLFPPQTLKIIQNEEQAKYITYAENVEEVLEEHNIEYSDQDLVMPDLETPLHTINIIRIYSVEEELKEVINQIPFLREIIYDNTLPYGTEKIIQHGINGQEKEIYKEIYTNSELTSKKLYKSEIVKNPQNQIVKIGTQRTALEGRNCEHWYAVVDSATSDQRERDILKFLISCESKCNAGANNSNRYLGLLQFHRNTFNHYGSGDIWDGEAQIHAALGMIRGGGLDHHWPACANRYHRTR